jgi:hypothetical protein
MSRSFAPLSGPRFRTDPVQLYRDMRRDQGSVAPVVPDGDVPAWPALGYRELRLVTSDPVLFSRDPELWNQWDGTAGALHPHPCAPEHDMTRLAPRPPVPGSPPPTPHEQSASPPHGCSTSRSARLTGRTWPSTASGRGYAPPRG